jgi:acyl dehydratase
MQPLHYDQPMAEEFEIGDRVQVIERRSQDVPLDVVGLRGAVQWVTPGFAGERGYVEVELDDGRTFQFQTKELSRA